jgi:soluble lytic murein transglycosylase
MARLGICLTAAFLFFAAGEIKADIYTYRDSQGTLHFSNVPNHKDYRLLIKEGDGRPAQSQSVTQNDFQGIILSASERYGVDADLVRAVIKVESDYNVFARSRKGAQGLMQLMPQTARLHKVANVDDPAENIRGGVRHLRLLLDRFGEDLGLTLAAYNAGIKAVEQYRGIPPYAETQEYVRRVLHFHDRYRRNGSITIRESVRP